MVFHTIKQAARFTLALGLALTASVAQALNINMPYGVTPVSHEVYNLHMMVLWVCVVIGFFVFGAMIWAIFSFRKSKGAKAAQFHESTTLEIAWTIVPVIILVAMAIPAAKVLVRMSDTSDPTMNIKITGYQWKWQYEYLEEGFSFFSMLSSSSDRASQLHSGINPDSVPHYLRDVDHPLVVPTGEKIRLLITSDDVIHSWWMPDFGGKTDANPGFINTTWIKVDQPGVYRGACAELCGRWHGFMPIVVVAKTPADYQSWVNAMKAANGKYVNPLDGSLESNGSPVAFEHTTYSTLLGPQSVAATPSAPAPAASGPKPAALAPKITSPGPKPSVPAPKPAAAAPVAPPAAGWTMQTAMARGKQVYDQNCASCHMPDGSGNKAIGAKAIAGGSIPNGPLAAHIQLVLKGKGIMPPWGNMLSDQDLAAVITFERNSFGNHKGDLVKPEDIKAAR